MTWRVAVDIGGTFTDLVAWDPERDLMTAGKVLTVPDDPVRGVEAAIEQSRIRLDECEGFVHGSTIAINAVLQLRGARTALLTTRGFRDVLEMGRKNRPDMYNLFFRPRLCPIPRALRYEIDERIDAAGAEVHALDADEVLRVVRAIPPDVESIAVSFLHACVDPRHEQEAMAVVRSERPDVFVSASSELSREMGEYERTSTAAVNAYVGPLVSRYVERLSGHLASEGCRAPLLITQSNGGMMTAGTAARQPVRTMESGPAAGVTGSAWLGSEGVEPGDLIAFDMGGTSAKVCVVQHGEPEHASEYHIGGRITGLPVQVPFLDIVEVGAGGGSIAHVDSAGGLRVGPRSAGSVPGPACYARGGTEATITDANVVLGRIDPGYFLGGAMALDTAKAECAVARVGERLGLSLTDTALGIVRVANTIMSAAIRSVTLERGRDPRDYTLVAYGGAGPVHAASLALELSVPRVLVPSQAGSFGAFGMLVTDLRHDAARSVLGRLESFPPDQMEAMFRDLEDEALAYVNAHFAGGNPAPSTRIRRFDLRYVGQFHPLTLTLPPESRLDHEDIARLFHQAHRERYGHNAPMEPVEVRALRVTVLSPVTKPTRVNQSMVTSATRPARMRRVMFDDGVWRDAAVHRRGDLGPGAAVEGPAVVEDETTAIPVPAGVTLAMLDGGHAEVRLQDEAA